MASTNLQDLAAGKRPASPLAEFSRFLEKIKPQMALALPKHMNADRMTRLALTAFSTTPALQECTHQSIAASIMTASQLGLEIGVQGQGYLIPYKTTCTFVPGWKGLVDLVARAGRATVWTGVVFKNDGDRFEYQLGDAPFVRHTPADDMPDGAQWTHVYAVGRVKDAQMPVIEVWSRSKVERHLKQYNKVGGRHYANSNDNNFEMYARKVALLQVLKYMPSSVELSAAMTIAQAEDEGKNVVIDGDFITTATDPETGEITPTTPTNDAAKAAAETASNQGAKPEVKPPTYAQLADMLGKATNADTGAQVLDLGRHLPDDQRAELGALFEKKFPN